MCDDARPGTPWVRQLQKLLFSATLTRNPSKIASLRLVQPRYFAVTSAASAARFTVPATLKVRASPDVKAASLSMGSSAFVGASQGAWRL